MKKSRLVFVAMAVAAVLTLELTSRASSTVPGRIVSPSEPMYEITDSLHPFQGYVGTFDEVDALCPETGQQCAEELGSGTGIIEWRGPSLKF